MEYSDRFNEVNKRMDYLKKFYPFFKIYTSSNIQKNEYDVPFLALAILTLLIEKGRLLGRSVPIEEIENYIQKTITEIYPSIPFDHREVTRTILGMLETDKGMLYLYQYFDPLRQRTIDEYIQLIEYDVKKGEYRITDTGLDFMISIKELPEESKISITLILFKKQIENGSFRSALGTIQDLNLAVQLKKRTKEVLLEKFMAGGSDAVGDFEQYSRGIFSQLKHENELFTQVHLLLNDIYDNQDNIANNPEFSEKEEEFIIIKQIAIEVEHGYNIHNELLREFTNFPEEYERINRIKLNSLFEKRYQFQQALENHIRSNLSNEVHITTIQPMLNLRVPKKFNLLKIFEPQPIAGKKNDITDTRSTEDWTDEKTIEDLVGERQAVNFKIYATILLITLSEKNRTNLSTYLDEISLKVGKEGIENVDLIPFLLELNSNAEVHFNKDDRKRDPFENIFDLSDIRNFSGQRDLIEESLYRACEKVKSNGNILRVICQPDSHVKIGGNDKVCVSDMIFIVE